MLEFHQQQQSLNPERVGGGYMDPFAIPQDYLTSIMIESIVYN
jgi:hypothetical protein